MIGITSYGVYIPRLRLERMAIAQSMGWFAPAIIAVAQGERSMCNWDEDAITMAVSASKDCLIGKDKQTIDSVLLASTTLPFADRQNAGIISSALNLRQNILTSDFTASQKAGTTALISAMDSVKAGERRNILLTATDKRETKAAGFYEMWYGDAAASLMVGDTDVIAEYKGSSTLSCDFVDHYRGSKNQFDYVWEERWVRDAGYSKIIPQVIQELLTKLNITVDSVDKFIYPCFFKAEHNKIAKTLGLSKEQVVGNLHEVCGETGVAHPFLMLAAALENSKPGDCLIVAGFGQGCNALCFVVTHEIEKLPKRQGFKGSLAKKKTLDQYPKWLKFRDLLPTDMGIRAEAPTQTAMTTLWRKNKMILGLVGGKCRECGTPQFPKMDICVNPKCGAVYAQDDYEFADMPAKLKTFTADMLSVSVDPPALYGMVQFDNGGRFMADLTDCELSELKVGLPLEMAFKRKVVDQSRGFTNYFWKAVPIRKEKTEVQEEERLRLDGRVAIVTGAGGGLGKVYALALAKRGAKVVINDLGGARDGSGQGSTSPADKVVEEIKAFGGEAISNYDSVATAEGGEKIIKSAIDAFGRVDIIINNAGILRDKSLLKMDNDNWRLVLDVHLNGAYNVTRPALKHMKDNNYGRIILTTSAAGLYGNFGQSNYSAAKMALIGFMNSLKLEGMKSNIFVNTIAPLAASRLTSDILPPDLFEKMKPECVVPIVIYLCSDACKNTGMIYNAGMGYYNRAAIVTGPGVQLGTLENPPTPEDIEANWNKIDSLDSPQELTDLNAALVALLTPKEKTKTK